MNGVPPEDSFPGDDSFEGAELQIFNTQPEYRAEDDDLIGSKLADRYEVISAIGFGGMGIIYRGRHILMDKIVAIKVLNTAYATWPDALARFQREAQIACQLKHPNIVTVYDFGIVDNKLFYLVMDLIEGHSLSALIDKSGHLPARRVISIVSQVCNALAYAHERAFIHRDLKPGNIMIVQDEDGSEHAMILDFGLAKFFGEGKEQQQLSQTGAVLGTGLYMSPEQCRGKQADVRSEIYSLGCVVYECITGSPPLMGENVLETFQKHIEEVPPPMSQRRPDLVISPALETVVAKALEKDPARRFQTMRELNQALASTNVESRSAPLTATTSHASQRLTPVAPTLLISRPDAGGTASFDQSHSAAPPPAGVQPVDTPEQAPLPDSTTVTGAPVSSASVSASDPVSVLDSVSISVSNSVSTSDSVSVLDSVSTPVSEPAPNPASVHAQSSDSTPTSATTKSTAGGGTMLSLKIAASLALVAIATALYSSAGLFKHTAPNADRQQPAPPVQSKIWAKFFHDATIAFDQEKFEESESLLQQSISEARRARNDQELAQSLRKLQDVLYVEKKLKDADALDQQIERAVSAARQSQIGDSSGAADAVDKRLLTETKDDRVARLAISCHQKGQCDTAVRLLEHSIEISKRLYGENSPKTAKRMEELASLLIALDETDEAERVMNEVMEIKAAISKKAADRHSK